MLLSLFYPDVVGLPRISAGSAPVTPFSRPAQRSLHVTAYMLAKSTISTFYTRGFDGFVASAAAPIATGWSDQLPGGYDSR